MKILREAVAGVAHGPPPSGYDQTRPAADPLLDYMRARGLPITRELYLAIECPEGPPAELEQGLPRELELEEIVGERAMGEEAEALGFGWGPTRARDTR